MPQLHQSMYCRGLFFQKDLVLVCLIESTEVSTESLNVSEGVPWFSFAKDLCPALQREKVWFAQHQLTCSYCALHRRGVRFGLDGGRVESIMVSAPPLASWRYGVKPASGSDEEALIKVLRTPRAWA